MPMALIVTRNVPNRYKGFLASYMLEITPGVFVAPRMTKAVRERVWTLMTEWSESLDADAGILLLWPDPKQGGGLGLRFVGWPRKEFVDCEGMWLSVAKATKAQLAAMEADSLATTADPEEDRPS